MSRTLIAIVCTVLLGYGFFESRLLIEGPTITILSPLNGSATSTTALLIKGTAHNISFLTINDKPAYTDQAGNFALTVSPPTGYEVVTVAAKDRFGRRSAKSVFITVLNFCPVG